MPSPPNRSTVAGTSADTAVASIRSASMASTSPLPAAAIRPRAASSFSGVRPQMATLQPARASRTAQASPMPSLPAVPSAVRPASPGSPAPLGPVPFMPDAPGRAR